MKTTSNRIKTFFGTAALMLISLALSRSVTAQTVARIAFESPVATGKRTSFNQIFSMNPDGSGIVQLTSTSANSSAPRWSPGQAYIAFWRNNTLWIMSAIGEANGGQSFAVGAAGGYGSDWSPDGSSLVFRGTNGGLYIVSVNASAGTTGIPVLFRSGYFYDPSWSPDGSRIAFWGGDDGITELIHVRNVTTGAEISFGAGATHNYVPQWSPDGNRIAFTGPVTTTTTGRTGKTTTVTYQEILLANADGSGITQVTYWNNNTYYPTWSPDGTTLVFKVSGGLYKMILGSNAATLLYSGGNNPDWKP